MNGYQLLARRVANHRPSPFRRNCKEASVYEYGFARWSFERQHATERTRAALDGIEAAVRAEFSVELTTDASIPDYSRGPETRRCGAMATALLVA
jgi:hypothetical protein